LTRKDIREVRNLPAWANVKDAGLFSVDGVGGCWDWRYRFLDAEKLKCQVLTGSPEEHGENRVTLIGGESRDERSSRRKKQRKKRKEGGREEKKKEKVS